MTDRPHKENYSFRTTNHVFSQEYEDDLNKYIDQQDQSHKAEVEEAFEAGANGTTLVSIETRFKKWLNRPKTL